MIMQGAVKLNGERIDSPDESVELTAECVLKVGKKTFARFRV
ncbi:MAG: hypothetical protein U5N86_13600 [Planctomycetota bacterium]|nr:hypothetical protein [Planctomycetota bacterium]